MEILSVTHAHGRALCLYIGEEASDSNIHETQRQFSFGRFWPIQEIWTPF